ncbi:alpha/beta fold hydrolase [Halalkalicoccus jeotgali]|uniref:Alpha/beta hydrolase fold protein n=1 Tax=Halalkalicoccus jeotgali (strain DSM 18796 / CECT 7217 / JCM 14584 / KCTC 4019 / B3) TaxID=795797 RepID=D8JA64_HALJB|nr:alpha/beta hydrolase [Halalkalicoccus jeotgali]ADJ14586.1 alpha/beta hydrolase fold protein [Halalkalicoccus jeotgali B3]ELY39958.1 alpha/beta hydrolase fold protein [Halalkalicoccus jeotgali B3]
MTTTDAPTIGLAYDDDGSGPPLVFLHGGWLSAASWAGQRERFGEEYRVITPDLRGHGRTGASESRRYSIGLLAADLDALLSELGIEECVLCGLSLGSMVAQTYAARHPGRIRGLVLAGAVQTFPPVAIPGPMKRLLTPLPMLASSLALTGSGATFRSLLSTIRPLTGGPWLARDSEVRATALETVEAMPRDEFKKVFAALYRFRPPELDRLSAPARVVYGEHEAPPVKRQSRDLASALGCDVHEIRDAAHLVNQDNPEAFDAVLTGLLEEVER